MPLRLRLRAFGISAAAGIFIRTGLGILLALLCRFRIGFRFRLCVGGGLPGGVFALLLLLAQRQHAGVFGHLRGAAGCSSDRRAALFPLVVVLGALEHVFRLLDAGVGILLSAGGLSDGHGIAGLQQIEWDRRLSLRRWKLLGGHVDDVFPAFQYIELRVNRLFKAFGLLQDNVFRNHLIAGMSHREIRLCSDDEAKRLQIGGNAQFALAIVSWQDFAEIDGPALGSDRPKHICQVLAAKFCGRVNVVQIDIDRQPARFAVNLGPARDRRHQAGAFEVHGCRTTSIAIVHRSRATRVNVDAEYRGLGTLFHRLLLLRLRVRWIPRRGIQRRSGILLGEH